MKAIRKDDEDVGEDDAKAGNDDVDVWVTTSSAYMQRIKTVRRISMAEAPRTLNKEHRTLVYHGNTNNLTQPYSSAKRVTQKPGMVFEIVLVLCDHDLSWVQLQKKEQPKPRQRQLLDTITCYPQLPPRSPVITTSAQCASSSA